LCHAQRIHPTTPWTQVPSPFIRAR
jgi:hypothetical protein